MPSGQISPAIMTQVEAVLPADGAGLSYAQVHGLVGQWAPVTMRHAIRQLIEEGRARRAGSGNAPRFLRVVS